MNFPIVPAELELYPFQKRGVNFLVREKENGYHGGLLFDEPGLGKSVQTIVALNYLRAKKEQIAKILLIGPAIMCLTWEEEIHKWSTWNPKVEVMNKLSDRPTHDCDVLICSYNWVSYASARHPKTKKEYKHPHYWNLKWLVKNYIFDTLIVDEMHKCKSHTANRAKAIVGNLFPLADIKIALTGTPMTKGVDDLYMQLIPFVKHPQVVLGRSYFQFRSRFMNGTQDGFGMKYSGVRNEEQLKEIISKVSLRRLKEKVLPELPSKNFKRIVINIPKKIARDSLRYVELAVREITGQASEDHLVRSLYDHVATMKRALGVAKCKGIVEYIIETLEANPKEPLVVAAYHKDVISIISKSLDAKGITHRCITGATSNANRQKFKNEFQEGKLQAIILNMEAGGVGITLTASPHIVVCELHWTPAVLSQVIDRIHRISQKADKVFVDFILGKDSLDARIYSVLLEKMKVFKKVLD